MPAINKEALRKELLSIVEKGLEAARASHAAAIEGATHPEARAENDKDTRGLEQSYLARGVAQRVVDLENAVADLTAMKLRVFAAGAPVAISAVVTVEEGETQSRYFVAPAGGGSVIGDEIHVITPQSPIGKVLVGRRVDDELELKIAGKTRELVIVMLV